MNNKKESKFKTFINRHRILTITVFLFLIVLPVILIPTVYISQAVSARHILFEDKNIKAIQIDEQNYFDITFSLYRIYDSTEDSAGKYAFDYEIVPRTDSINTVKSGSVSFRGQLSVVNDKYSVINNYTSTLKSTTSTKFQFDWEYDMDQSILPFLKPKGPTLYLEITFTYVMAEPLNAEEVKTIYVKVPYN